MNHFIAKYIIVPTVLAACLFPFAMRADGSRGHRLRSGIVGQAYVSGNSSWLNGPPAITPVQTHITIYALPPARGNSHAFSTTGRYVADVETDADGNFVVDLKAGRYLLVLDEMPDLLSNSTFIEVKRNQYTTTVVSYFYPFVTN